MGFGVVGDGLCHGGADIRVGHTEVGIERDAAPEFTFSVDQSKVPFGFRGDFLRALCPAGGGGNAERFCRPAVSHIVELEAAFGDFHLALTLPLEDGFRGDGFGRTVSGIVVMGVVGIVVGEGDVELKHIGVHLEFGVEVDGFKHTLLVLCPFVALSAETVVGFVTVGDGGDGVQGDVFAVDTGIEPAAAVFAEVTVDGEQNAAGIASGEDTAVFVGLDEDNIVERGVFDIGGVEVEVFEETEAVAVGSVGGIGDGNITGQGHHHAEVFFEFLGGKIDDVVSADFSDSVHGLSSVYHSQFLVCCFFQSFASIRFFNNFSDLRVAVETTLFTDFGSKISVVV